MEAAELNRLRDALKASVPDAISVVVQPHSVAGVNIKIVAPSFGALAPLQRRNRIEQALGKVQVSFMDLLTPEEDQAEGLDLKDLDPEDLPFWPETLGHRTIPRVPRFLDADSRSGLNRPLTAAFYSIKGGVGRTTSLAFAAGLLADRGYSVVAVDMDLEAPGLPQVFGLHKQMEDRISQGIDLGVVSLLTALDFDPQAKVDVRPHLLRVSERKDLYCLPAGRVDRLYIQRLDNLRFEQFYRLQHNPLHKLIDAISEQLKPDVILIDARTGITAHNAPLLFDVADLAMIVFLPTDQTEQPFRMLLEGMLNTYNRHGYTPQFRFVLSLVPSNDVEPKTFYRKGLSWAEEAVEAIARRRGERDLGLMAEETVTQVYYQETLALAGRALESGPFKTGYQQIAEWIAAFVPERQEPAHTTTIAKDAVLKDLSFGGGSAEQQAELLDFFVRTRDYEKAVRPETVLIRGRKGTGKTALFRYLSERPQRELFIPWVISTPAQLQGRNEPFLNRAGYEAAAGLLERSGLSWSDFWAGYILLQLHQKAPGPIGWQPREQLAQAIGTPGSCTSQEDLLDRLAALFVVPQAAVRLSDELRRYDAALDQTYFLLFDGLDTGFGSKPGDLQRRSDAVNGLFELLIDLGMGLQMLRMKIFLRSDIYRTVTVQNKSHLYNRDVTLNWEQLDFLRTVINQAWRSDQFRRFAKERLPEMPAGAVETWSEKVVLSVLHLIVGERMKGGNTTFTRNWIWNRLSDGNGDHSPRYLFQVFQTALRRELTAGATEAYDRSLIRPRFLMEALPEVSERAVSALREEYQELGGLMDYLTERRSSPLALEGVDRNNLALAEEAGLLFKYEEMGAVEQRYAVPDLYLYGLGMARKGQA